MSASAQPSLLTESKLAKERKALFEGLHADSKQHKRVIDALVEALKTVEPPTIAVELKGTAKQQAIKKALLGEMDDDALWTAYHAKESILDRAKLKVEEEEQFIRETVLRQVLQEKYEIVKDLNEQMETHYKKSLRIIRFGALEKDINVLLLAWLVGVVLVCGLMMTVMGMGLLILGSSFLGAPASSGLMLLIMGLVFPSISFLSWKLFSFLMQPDKSLVKRFEKAYQEIIDIQKEKTLEGASRLEQENSTLMPRPGQLHTSKEIWASLSEEYRFLKEDQQRLEQQITREIQFYQYYERPQRGIVTIHFISSLLILGLGAWLFLGGGGALITGSAFLGLSLAPAPLVLAAGLLIMGVGIAELYYIYRRVNPKLSSTSASAGVGTITTSQAASGVSPASSFSPITLPQVQVVKDKDKGKTTKKKKKPTPSSPKKP